MENSCEVCRLCLNTINDRYVPVDEIIIGKLQNVSLELAENIPNGSVICKSCEENLEKYCFLKYQLIKTEELQATNDITKTEPSLDFREVGMWKDYTPTEIEYEAPYLPETCEICGKHINNDTFESINFTETMEELLLGFSIAPNSKTCKCCMEILEELTSFKNICLNTQEVITNYCEKFRVKNSTNINLHHVRFRQRYSASNCSSPMTSSKKTTYTYTPVYEVYELACAKSDKKLNLDDVSKVDEKKQSSFVSDSESNYKVIIYETIETEVKPLIRNGVRMYMCPKCNELVANMEQHIEQHQNIMANVKFRCIKCDYTHESKSELKSHMKTHKVLHKTTEFYSCDQCSFKSKQKGNLQTHSHIHENPEDIKMFKCPLCKFQARQKGNLKTHLLTHKRPEDTVMFKCNMCSFQSRQKGNLQTHMVKTHCKIKDKVIDSALSFKCHLCSYKSKQKNYLKKHLLRSHSPS
ncbi:hypothetical protein JTB14_025611 [Gonioctena quinquepunctata]|nr:hypothetical protein JTB14_025611 [Gonioctena quinquepunctata]